jgi:hypothetical protein
MKRYKLTYADRYCYAQCNGTRIIEADSNEFARELALEWLRAHGGIEGLLWSLIEE